VQLYSESLSWRIDRLIARIIPGIEWIFIFIPQIAFLFLFISILEESGEPWFLMDKIMQKFGLSGKV
jgi:ferrous iron transport protein B